MSQSVQNKSSESVAQIPVPNPQKTVPSWMANVVTGGIAGASGAACAVPFLNVKNEYQGIKENCSFVEKTKRVYPVFKKNPSKLFTGIVTVPSSVFPATAASYAVSNAVRRHISQGEKREPTYMEKMAASTLGGIASVVFTVPSENSQACKQPMREIIETRGLKGLYRGWFFTGKRDIVFTINDQVFAKDHPFLASIVGAILSHPADTYKTRQQQNPTESLWSIVRANPSAGLGPRLGALFVYYNVAPRVRQAIEDHTSPKPKAVFPKDP